MPDIQRLVVFDFDGPIVNTLDAAWAVAKLGNSSLTLDAYREMFSGNILEALATKKSLVYPAGFDFWTHYRKGVLPLSPVKGMAHALESLQTAGLPMAIVSSTHTKEIESYLDKHGLRHFFLVILGADVDPSKVKKFSMLHDVYHVDYHNMVFITDTLGDLIESSKLDIPSIAVTWGYHDEAKLAKGPHAGIINDPYELVPAIKNILPSD